MNFGRVSSGSPARSTEFQGLSNGEVTYAVTYPGHDGLESVAVLGLTDKELRTETFEGRWQVVYAYNEEHPSYAQIPASFEIFGISDSGRYDRLINTYTFVEFQPENRACCIRTALARKRESRLFIS